MFKKRGTAEMKNDISRESMRLYLVMCRLAGGRYTYM